MGTIPITRSTNKPRIEENLNLFDFSLSEEDHKILKEYAIYPIQWLVGSRLAIIDSSGSITQHKNFPFNNFD